MAQKVNIRTGNIRPVAQENVISLFITNYAPWVYLGLSMLCAWFLFNDYLSGKLIYLFKDIGSDSVNFNYPQWVYLHEYLSTEGFPGWSFRQGMGQNYYGVGPAFGFGLMGPFIFLLPLLSPDQIPFAIIWFEVLKMIGGGMMFFLVLRTMGLQPLTCITGGLMYAYSGYMVLGSGWTGFSMEAFAVAFLLFGTEQLLVKRNWLWFPLALAYLTILQPFNLLPWGIFMLTYYVFRFYTLHGWDFRKLLNTTSILILLSVTGLCLSAFYAGSVLHIMLESPRGGGDASYADQLSNRGLLDLYPAIHNLSALYRLFSNDLIGGGLTFKGWNNYLESPIFYGSLLALLLFGQTLSKFREPRGKAYLLWFLFFILPVVFPYFRFAFWAFTGDYYRTYSLCLVLVILLGALTGLSEIEKKGKVNLYWLGGSLAFWLLMLYFPFELSKSLLDKNIKSQVGLFLVIHAVFIFLISRPAFRIWAYPAFLIFLCIELITLGHPTSNKRDMVKAKDLESRTAYNDYTREALEYLDKNDKGFYRIAKDYSSGPAYHTSLNDGLIQGFMGTSCYYSFNQKYYIEFLSSVGIVEGNNEFSTRWAQGLNNRPLLLTMAGSRYTLHKGDNPYLYGFGYDSLTQFNDVKIFKNRYALPFGFVYKQWVSSENFKQMSPFVKDKTMLQAAVLQKPIAELAEPMPVFSLSDTSQNFTFEYYQQMADVLRKDTLALETYGQNLLKGTVSCSDSKGILMLPMSYDTGWKVKLNGNSVDLLKINEGLSGIFLTQGNHSIEMQYEVPYLKLSLWISLMGLGLFAGIFFLQVSYFKKEKSPEKDPL